MFAPCCQLWAPTGAAESLLPEAKEHVVTQTAVSWFVEVFHPPYMLSILLRHLWGKGSKMKRSVSKKKLTAMLLLLVYKFASLINVRKYAAHFYVFKNVYITSCNYRHLQSESSLFYLKGCDRYQMFGWRWRCLQTVNVPCIIHFLPWHYPLTFH